ncbi:hypothetical protein [Oerskovia paurometabola]|uniref:hypothetical protein n=1 Tax=Oerskovia paurometabola TaxID=162170 RepID=UPI003814D389
MVVVDVILVLVDVGVDRNPDGVALHDVQELGVRCGELGQPVTEPHRAQAGHEGSVVLGVRDRVAAPVRDVAPAQSRGRGQSTNRERRAHEARGLALAGEGRCAGGADRGGCEGHAHDAPIAQGDVPGAPLGSVDTLASQTALPQPAGGQRRGQAQRGADLGQGVVEAPVVHVCGVGGADELVRRGEDTREPAPRLPPHMGSSLPVDAYAPSARVWPAVQPRETK